MDALELRIQARVNHTFYKEGSSEKFKILDYHRNKKGTTIITDTGDEHFENDKTLFNWINSLSEKKRYYKSKKRASTIVEESHSPFVTIFLPPKTRNIELSSSALKTLEMAVQDLKSGHIVIDGITYKKQKE